MNKTIAIREEEIICIPLGNRVYEIRCQKDFNEFMEDYLLVQSRCAMNLGINM